MGNLTLSGANATLTYSAKGMNVARLRCSLLPITYSQISTESHARQHRAFYPHRRSQGGFALQLDCKGWREFNLMIAWFRDYATVVLNLNNIAPPPMTVSIPARDFLRLGVPTIGLQYGDFVGSNVFSPQIQFISLSDPSDATTAILRSNQVSGTTTASVERVDPATNYFYPDSIASYPGQLAAFLYDQGAADRLATAAELQAQLTDRLATPSVGHDGMSAY